MFGKLIDIVTQPISDTIDILEGLTEGEIRAKAIIRLGSDVVAGMSIQELIKVLAEDT